MGVFSCFKGVTCGAYLIKLVRTQAGKFRIENSIPLDNIDIKNNLINPLEMLDMSILKVGEENLVKIKNGQYLKNKNIKHGDLAVLVYNNNEICAIAQADDDKIKMKKVFL